MIGTKPVLAVALLLLVFAAACASKQTPRPVSAVEARPGWTQEGVASWYGGDDGFEGKPTASGEIYDGSQFTAAHRELPLGTILDVVDLDNGKKVRVRVNDRGPYIKGRIIDLSRASAREIGLIGPGLAPVRLTVVSPGREAEPVTGSRLWTVQVGSFADRGRAQRHAERVRATGRSVYLEPYQGLSRVRVGPYDSRRAALDALGRLQDEGFEGIVTPAK